MFRADWVRKLSESRSTSMRSPSSSTTTVSSSSLLLAAKNPVIWAGQGVHYAQAGERLAALAELIPAPVCATNPGKSAIAETHPLSLGASTRSSQKGYYHFLNRSDVVLAIGSSMTKTSFGPTLPRRKRIIHSTNYASDINKDVVAEIGLVGDAALVVKDFAELRHSPGIFIPSLITGVVAIIYPFIIAVIVPAVTGQPLSDSSDFEVAIEMYRTQPATRGLDPEAAIQAYLFQFFAVMLVLIPVTSSMSLAAHSVVGEKQARSLEPLLVTPITTFELLGAKVLGAFIPSILLTAGFFLVYIVTAALLARPGVAWALLGPRMVGIVFILGPLAALAALQMAVCVSSRVNDARTAQQIGVFVILPIAGLLVGQLAGAIELTVTLIAWITLGLLVVNAGLMRVGIALFDRETILTRWR